MCIHYLIWKHVTLQKTSLKEAFEILRKGGGKSTRNTSRSRNTNTEKHFEELQKEHQQNWLQEGTYIYPTLVYIAAYQCCKGKRKGQVHYYQKKVNANLIWIRHEHPVTFPLNSAECTIRWFIPVGFFFFFSFFLMLAMQTHRGKKQKQQIQLDLIPRYAPAQLFFFFFFFTFESS